tara:strand:- start:1264 stop:1500 length:237 start_codon:yes stop_codon:yes gene_type:complete
MTKCKPKKKKKLTGMAYRYECAWHHCFVEASDYIQKVVISEPHGRYAENLAHDAARLAESEHDIPCIHTGEYLQKKKV